MALLTTACQSPPQTTFAADGPTAFTINFQDAAAARRALVDGSIHCD